MKRFLVLTNEVKDAEGVVTNEVCSYLAKQGAEVSQLSNEGEVTGDPDCVIVLGGDGSLLRAAKRVVNREIPLLGINLGTLGFLAEVEREQIQPCLDKVLADEVTIEKRMMLSGSIFRNGELIEEDIALNDIVLSRVIAPRMMLYSSYVNGEYLNTLKADGIIISTATGSTGYALSAGGPIVSPNAELILMTALAPHTINTRSIVFPGSDRIMIEIGSGRGQDVTDSQASFDGSAHYNVREGDQVVITRSEKQTRIIKIKKESFLQVLRSKMRMV